MVRQDNSQDFYFELLRKTLRNISDDEIDLFLYYGTEAAISIVADLIDKQNLQSQQVQKLNKIDKEVKNLATRIRKSANFNLYKNAA
jgi:hypothetical protein